MPKIASQKERTRRAVAACRDLLETADWLRERLNQQLESLELTMLQYRVLEILYLDGPRHQRAIRWKLRSSDQGLAEAIHRLEEKGWVRRETSTLTAAPGRAMRAGPKAVGRKVQVVHLTPEGEERIGYIFPKHAKLVKEEMRALEGREQLNLSRLCRKLLVAGPGRIVSDRMGDR